MTTLNGIDAPPRPAMPPRPARPLSTWQILKTRGTKTRGTDSLALCDEALFDEPFAERRLLWHRIFVVNDPDGIRRVLIDNFENYRRHALMRRPVAPGLRTGMLINDGALWRRHRRLVNPALDYRATLTDFPMLVEWTQVLAQHLAAVPRGQAINIGHMMAPLITVSVGHVFAGADRDIQPMLTRMAKFPGRRRATDFLPIPDWLRPRAYQIRAEACSWYPLVDRLIAERRRPDYAGGQDLLWRLAHARSRDGDRLSEAELRDEALTLALGGIETTLRPMCWVWYLLALHPWAEAQLHSELDAVLGGRAPQVDELAKLSYLRKLVDETMRLYPPVPVMLRTNAEDDVLCGRPIRRGSTVVVAPWIVHRHRRLWRDPDNFDPERFAPEAIAARSRYAFLPFAVGPRTCIAAPLAMMQLHVAVAILAQRFRFRLVPGHAVEPAGWTTLRPNRGIRVTVEPR
jgi:cytochrome P450